MTFCQILHNLGLVFSYFVCMSFRVSDNAHCLLSVAGFMLVYLLALQMLITALGYLLKWKHIAAILAGLLVTSLALVSGLPVHAADLGVWCKWLGVISPVKWILPVLIAREYRPDSLAASTGLCRNKQVPVLIVTKSKGFCQTVNPFSM